MTPAFHALPTSSTCASREPDPEPGDRKIAKRIQIIGVGAPYGDDQLGWVAAEALRNSPLLAGLAPQSVIISQRDRPGLALLEMVQDSAKLILVDAIRAGTRPGTLHRLTAPGLSTCQGLLSSHGYGIAAALEIGRVMGSLPPQVVIFGLEIAGTAGDKLSPAVHEALPRLIQEIEREVVASLSF